MLFPGYEIVFAYFFRTYLSLILNFDPANFTEFFLGDPPAFFSQTLKLRLRMILGSMAIKFLNWTLTYISGGVFLFRAISFDFDFRSWRFLVKFDTLQLINNFE